MSAPAIAGRARALGEWLLPAARRAFRGGDTAVDLLTALPLAAGFGAALLRALALTPSTAAAAVCATADAVLVCLFCRWWRRIVPALLCAAGAGALLLWARGMGKDAWRYGAGFFEWWARGLGDTPPYADNGSIALVLLLAALPVAAGVWGFLRRAFRLEALAVLSCAAIAALCNLSSGAAPAVIALLSMGLIVALPRAFHRVLRRGGETAIPRAALQWMAVPAALLCVGAAWLIVPADASGWRFEPLVRAVGDVGDLLRFCSGAPPGHETFSIARSGWQPLGDRLGGAIDPGPGRVLLYHGERPALLAGSIQDVYTGENWEAADGGGRFRLESLLWRPRRDGVFGLDLPEGRQARELYARLTVPLEADIRYYAGFSAVFAPGRVREIELQNPAGGSVYFDLRGEIFADGRIGSYRVEADAFRTGEPGFGEAIAALERAAADRRDGAFEGVCERYLKLPDSLPEEVRRAAREMAGEGTPYERAASIERRLREDFTYTLTPDDPPRGGDFVAHFLETREGYCVYYATAMAVLARCEGIPARYVTGYGLRRNGASGDYIAADDTAHAWAELYFSGIGWMPFDPLGWDASLAATELPAPEADERQAPEQKKTVPGQNLSGDGGEGEAPRTLPLWPVFFALLGAAALAGLFAAGTRWLRSRPRRLYRPERVRRLVPDAGERFEAFYADLLCQLALFDLSPRPGETLAAFLARCDRRLPESGVGELTGAAERWRYGMVLPEETALAALAVCHDVLEVRLRERLGGAYLPLRAVAVRAPERLRRR